MFISVSVWFISGLFFMLIKFKETKVAILVCSQIKVNALGYI